MLDLYPLQVSFIQKEQQAVLRRIRNRAYA